MNANIGEDELALLTFLHENAKGYDENFNLKPSTVQRGAGLDEDTFHKAFSYLKSHGLVGASVATASGYGGVHSFHINWVWLTHLGEDYMRELEKQPGIARKLTVGTLKELGKVAQEVAVKVLTAHLAGHP